MDESRQSIIDWVALHVLPNEGYVRARLRRVTRRSDEIDDVIQEAYCRIAELDTVAHIRDGRAYFLAAARSILLRRIRRERVVRIDAVTDVEAMATIDDSERKLTNVVIAPGDVHKHHAGVVPSREGALDSAPAAVEFVSTSISSGGDGVRLPEDWKDVPADNPQCKLVDARRGYQLFDIGRDHWRTEVRVVERVTTPGGGLTTPARFVVERAKPGLQEA